MLVFLVNNLNKNTKYLGGMVKPNVWHFSSQHGGFQWNLSDVSRILRGTYGLLWKGHTCFLFQFPTLKSRLLKKSATMAFTPDHVGGALGAQ